MPAIVAKLKGLMPYAAIGLVPGGSVIALLLWLYQRYGIGPPGERLAQAAREGRSLASRGTETASPAATASAVSLKEAVCIQACNATAPSTMGSPTSTLEENDSLPSHHPTNSATGGLT